MARAAIRIVCAALACGACAGAGAVGMLGFFFVGRAMDSLGERAFAPAAPAGPPSWAASNGAAEIINDSLPLESSDGFAIMRARSPAPGALEIVVSAPKGAAVDPAELDRSWGPGVVEMFCGGRDTMWTRWIKIGGTVGVVVQTSAGDVARRYGASRSDCDAIASR